MTIFEKIKNVGLPYGQYVVIGGAVLDALGIRKTGDIDIAVTPELHKELRESGEWQEMERLGQVFLEKGHVEVCPDLVRNDYSAKAVDLIASAMEIHGIPFINLEELKKYKHALGRPKDIDDIELINAYLDKQKV